MFWNGAVDAGVFSVLEGDDVTSVMSRHDEMRNIESDCWRSTDMTLLKMLFAD